MTAPMVRGKPVRPCGTYAAYARHLRHQETPCGPCKAANAAHTAAWRSDRAQEEMHLRRAYDLRSTIRAVEGL